MHESSFYDINAELDRKEIIKPEKVFAMGLGRQAVPPSIGRFVVRQHYQNFADETKSTTEELPIVLCQQGKNATLFEKITDKEALYCLEDFTSYQLKGGKQDVEMYSLTVSFEVCLGQATCQPDAQSRVNQQTFRFPMQASYFNPTLSDDFIMS